MVSATTRQPPIAAAGAAAVHLPVPDYHSHPYRSLLAVFGLWKAFLLGLAGLATHAGPAYDTSGGLFSAADNGTAGGVDDGLVARLTSWDAIYYVEAARRGYRYEQEWAFGSGLPLAVASLRKVLVFVGLAQPSANTGTTLAEPVLAIAIAHAAHLLAVLLLYRLVRQLGRQLAGHDHKDRARHDRIAFVAACLHVLSPAGLFLSAPYSESGSALFAFAGYLAYATALWSPTSPLRLLAGGLFGVATVFRSNGLLNGLVFAHDAVVAAWALVQAVVTAVRGRPPAHRGRDGHSIRDPLLAGLVAGLAGLAVAAGSVIPQTVAYQQFCRTLSAVPGEDVRPWCQNMFPSIYTFVQERYWNTGLFRYWTLSNLPLFLLATPMLLVLTRSGLDAWANAPAVVGKLDGTRPVKKDKGSAATATATATATLIRCMAVSQLLLAILAFTSYHVQIITRLSSGCPLWYAWLAAGLAGGPRAHVAGHIVVFMVIYASVQGVLFASFLPPA